MSEPNPPEAGSDVTRAVTVTRKPPVQQIAYHGDVGDIIGLHIINLLLNICTLGIYSFWGKTRIRRYMTSHLALAKDRFEYTGTGMELFLGWLKALLIFIPLIILISIPVVNLFIYPVFFGVIAVAIYLAMRYRLSRTRWRGVSFALRGSAWAYLWISVKRTLVNIFTLGLKIPKSDIIKWSYLANHIKYGETSCTYEGSHKHLFGVHVKTVLIAIGLVALYGVWVALHIGDINSFDYFEDGMNDPDLTADQQVAKSLQFAGLLMKIFMPIYAVIFGAVIVRLWYHAELWKEQFRGLRLGNLEFRLDVTAPAMLKMYALNMVIIIFTLGLGKPITTHLMIRFFTDRLKIRGDVDALIVDQNRDVVKSGVADALAADVGFDLGM